MKEPPKPYPDELNPDKPTPEVAASRCSATQ
jgi:hypothetical protein